MARYEAIRWYQDEYNVADNNFLNAVVFSHGMTKEEAEAEAQSLNEQEARA